MKIRDGSVTSHQLTNKTNISYGLRYLISREKTGLEIELVDSVEVRGAWRGSYNQSCFFWVVTGTWQHGSTGNVIRLIGPAARDILQSKLSTNGQRNFIGLVAS